MLWKRPDDNRPAMLIVCTGNSCRSQMAEGLLKDQFGDQLRVFSAGSNPSGVIHPMAIEVMKEVGINIRRQKSQHWDDLPVENFDLIITVCDHAEDKCPLVPNEGGERMYIPIADPIIVRGTVVEVRQAFRQARERITDTVLPAVEEWLESYQDEE